MAHRCLVAASLALLAGCAQFHPRPISAEKAADSFSSRSLSDPGVRAFLAANQLATNSPQWNLKALTLVAFYYQPALAEARAQLLSAQAAKITAGQRPNPTVSVTPAYDTQIPQNPSPWLVPLSFDVPIETAGKRGKRIAQAEHLAEAARWNLVGTVWQVRSQIRTALFNFITPAGWNRCWRGRKRRRAMSCACWKGQFSAGAVSEFVVTQARIDLNTTQLAQQDAVGRFNQARVELAHALGVPTRALNGVGFSFAALNRFPRELTRPAVRRQALLSRADVRGALADYAASQSALQLEIANQYPDVHLGPGYAWNSGNAADNEWSLGSDRDLAAVEPQSGAGRRGGGQTNPGRRAFHAGAGRRRGPD